MQCSKKNGYSITSSAPARWACCGRWYRVSWRSSGWWL